MATNYSGRGGNRTERTNLSAGGFATGGSTKVTGVKAKVPPTYKGVNQAFAGKVNSYKELYKQTFGAAKHPRPTTTVLNSFANWINKGAVVQTVSCATVSKWARTCNKTFSTRNATPAACMNVLTTKFGKTTIKACARTKTGGFMVATATTWKGKPFCFPG